VLQPLLEDLAGGREPWDQTLAAEIIGGLAATPGAALPILHALQEVFGYVPQQSEGMIATALNISRAEVRGVISFYHDFHREPVGRHVLKICRAEACQSVGAVGVARRLLDRLGVEWGETSVDGSLTIEGVYCLGLCACGPAAMLDDQPLARLDDSGMDELVRLVRA
jgi:formate dehydrogenase subunit gamma